jgi:hypothetical protein
MHRSAATRGLLGGLLALAAFSAGAVTLVVHGVGAPPPPPAIAVAAPSAGAAGGAAGSAAGATAATAAGTDATDPDGTEADGRGLRVTAVARTDGDGGRREPGGRGGFGRDGGRR